MKNRCGDAAVEKTNYLPPHPPIPRLGRPPSRAGRVAGRGGGGGGGILLSAAGSMKSLVGVYLKVLRLLLTLWGAG